METENVIIYFCDFSADNNDVGPESLARIKAAIEYMLSKPNTSFNILLGAGLFKGNGKVAKELAFIKILDILNQNDFRESWVNFYTTKSKRLFLGNIEVRIYISVKDAWGTWAETLSIWSSFARLLSPYKTKIFSSKYHIPRIKLAWKFAPKCEIEFIGVKRKRTLKERCQYYIFEPLRYLKIIYMTLKFKFS